MFRIAEVLGRGWWNTRLRIVAEAPMQLEEKRLRYSVMRVATVSVWRLEIEVGESFVIAVPNSIGAKPGDRLSLDAARSEPALRARWTRQELF